MGLFDKKLYSTKKVMAGGTQISVRQVVGTGTDIAVQQLAAATVTARQWLQLAIPLLPSWQYTEKITPLFRLLFRTEPTPANMNIVMSVLQNINNGLQRPFAVKISNRDPSTLGYVTGYYAECVERGGGIYLFDQEDQVLRRQGEIHIYRGTLAKGDVATVTLIHEAGHRFANLEDFGDDGYFTEDYSDLHTYILSWEKCLRNADSYAAFVYFLANPAAATMRITEALQKRADRAARRAAAAGVDDPLNLGDLFG